MGRIVIDASALLALLQGEPGAEEAAKAVPDGLLSTVNLAEVVGKLAENGMPEDTARKTIDGLGLDIVPFDRDLGYATGMLRSSTRRFGLSLGDRACLALAARARLPALTTDRAWRGMRVAAEVRVIGRE